MTNYNTHSLQPNVSIGVRHECLGLAVAVNASFGPIQQEPEEAKGTIKRRKGAGYGDSDKCRVIKFYLLSNSIELESR